MRFLLTCLITPLAFFATAAAAQDACDIESHTGQDAECWDTFDIIQEMGEVGHHLVHDAECQQITEAIRTAGPDQSPHQLMLNISFVTYSNGYAAGVSKPADFVQVEMLSFCKENPSKTLQDFAQ